MIFLHPYKTIVGFTRIQVQGVNWICIFARSVAIHKGSIINFALWLLCAWVSRLLQPFDGCRSFWVIVIDGFVATCMGSNAIGKAWWYWQGLRSYCNRLHLFCRVPSHCHGCVGYAQGCQGYGDSLDHLRLLSAMVLSDCHGFGCYLQGFQGYCNCLH